MQPLDVVFLDVLEIAIGTEFQLVASQFVAYDDAMLVGLQRTDGPSLSHGAFDGCLQGTCLVVTIAENHHLLGIHHGAHTYGKRQARHLLWVAVEETGIGYLGIRGVFTRVREVSEEKGSLKAMCPSGPMPPMKRSIPPASFIICS